MYKKLFATVLLLSVCNGIQVSQILQKQRSQLLWKQEATNKFSWNATQELKWEVVNAFIDVQTSPDGDVFAIQKIQSELQETKYHLYLYNVTSNVWNIVDGNFEVKAVRFDRLGNMYYLDPKNCVRNSEQIKVVCGLKDFEVTVDKKIIGLIDDSGLQTAASLSSAYKPALVSPYEFKSLSGFKGITLLKDEPILIASDGTVDSIYGGEKLISISAGIDGSLWALQDEGNATDFTVLKWQTIAQKWYKVLGAKGTCLSAFNEISVAIVNSLGLLSLSSQNGHQNEADYVISAPQPPTSTYASTLAQKADFDWMLSLINTTTFTELVPLFKSAANVKTRLEAFNSIENKTNVFILYKTNYDVVSGFFFSGPFPTPNQRSMSRQKTFAAFSITNRYSYPVDTQAFSAYNEIQEILNIQGHDNTLDISPQCGQSAGGYNMDNFVEIINIGNSAHHKASKILTGNQNDPEQVENRYVQCVEIEIYQAN
ncbi:UNKNOWN [Stylonychia lemnae]|uniref:TLDc domain-containing protein n=1 Tax=Stylonychia lemnae TaxID=5949 RepID=A0A077ZUH7_STYLE|nr:UNKNOWN [Stylonychia lemnae]|eukprot:CDW73558.1 UNKNOWN [Stylonychia lemnae]